tara:strand:+ start:9332 stop:9778 length:447 start_codon:yes stop_codon:yes gene_type:complete
MRRIEDLIEIASNDKGAYRVRFSYNGRYTLSPYINRSDIPRMICILLGKRIQSMVNQRSYLVRKGFVCKRLEDQKAAIHRLNYRLSARSKWEPNNLKKYLQALLPDLELIAPRMGRYAQSWFELIVAVECFVYEERIESKIKALIKNA